VTARSKRVTARPIAPKLSSTPTHPRYDAAGFADACLREISYLRTLKYTLLEVYFSVSVRVWRFSSSYTKYTRCTTLGRFQKRASSLLLIPHQRLRPTNPESVNDLHIQDSYCEAATFAQDTASLAQMVVFALR